MDTPDERTWGLAELGAEKPLEEMTYEEEEAILDVALYISAKRDRDRKVFRKLKERRSPGNP